MYIEDNGVSLGSLLSVLSTGATVTIRYIDNNEVQQLLFHGNIVKAITLKEVLQYQRDKVSKVTISQNGSYIIIL